MGAKIIMTPIGKCRIAAEAGAIVSLHLDDAAETESAGDEALLARAERELQEYFDGERTAFDLPLRPVGTAFQLAVWQALRDIPYGETRTYAEIAAAVGKPKASRAVGGANHRNPILIITPCHRVIGADGSLTGFGAGLPVKEFLLNLERARVRG